MHPPVLRNNWRFGTGATVAMAVAALVFLLSVSYLVGLGPALPFLVLMFGIAAVAFALWVWALVDCAINEAPTGNDKIVWTMIIIFTTIVGAALYLRVRRPLRIAALGR